MTQTNINSAGPSGAGVPGSSAKEKEKAGTKDRSSGRLKKVEWQLVLTSNAFDLLDQDVEAIDVLSMDQPLPKSQQPKPTVKLIPVLPPPQNG